jgi:hypothetical protein
MKMWIQLLFLVAVFVGSIAVHADVVVSSHYAFGITQKEVLRLVGGTQFSGVESRDLEDMILESPYPTKIQGIHISGQYSAKVDSAPASLEYLVQTSASDLEIKIKKISTDTIIHRMVNGVNVEIFLKGQCNNLNIRSTNNADFNTQVGIQIENGHIVPNMVSLDIVQAPAWEVTIENCQAPAGYEATLKEEILKLFQDKQKIIALLASPIKQKVKDIAQVINGEIFKQVTTKLGKDHSISLYPSHVTLNTTKNLFLIAGNVELFLKTNVKENSFVEDEEFIASLGGVEKSGIYLSQKWISSAILTAKSKKELKYKFTSNSVSGLKSLFSNRLYQFFLWPDLMSFSKQAEFMFSGLIKKIYSFSFLGTQNSAVWYAVDGELEVGADVPKGNRLEHYGDFVTNVKSKFWIQVKKGVAVIGGYNPKLDLKFLWDKDYLQKYKPNQRISTNYFSEKIQWTLWKEQSRIELPTVTLAEDLSLSAHSVSGTKDHLFIEYITKDKTPLK